MEIIPRLVRTQSLFSSFHLNSSFTLGSCCSFPPTDCKPCPNHFFFLCHVFPVSSLLCQYFSHILICHLTILSPIFISCLLSSCSRRLHPLHSPFFYTPFISPSLFPPSYLVTLHFCCRVLASALSSRHSC